MKKCTKCDESLPLSSFYESKAGGHHQPCKTCRVKHAGAWNKANPKKVRAHWLQRYKMTPEQYFEKLAAQNGVCAICKRPPVFQRKWLSVDHDHTCCPGRTSCGKCIRGLLCQACNQAVGLLRDNVAALHNAIEYLNEYPTRSEGECL